MVNPCVLCGVPIGAPANELRVCEPCRAIIGESAASDVEMYIARWRDRQRLVVQSSPKPKDSHTSPFESLDETCRKLSDWADKYNGRYNPNR